MTNVYYTCFTAPLDPEALDDLTALLPVKVKEKAGRFRRWEDAHACVLGRVLLTRAVADFGLPCSLEDLRYTNYQRPYFEVDAFDFNISHSGHYVICAATDDGLVGIDIEEVKPIEINDFASQFHPEEWEQITGSADTFTRFYEFWTKKEAIIKADGMGLTIPLPGINTSNKSPIVLNGRKWHLEELRIDDQYKCTLALSTKSDHIEIKKVEF